MEKRCGMTELKTRVLVVDDEPQIRRFIRASLQAHGYDIEEAVNAEEALLKASTLKPDIVVLDLGLPDQDGLLVITRIREWSQVPIIVLSVRSLEQDKVEALDAGADDYVTKPFGMAELMARIRASLRNRLADQTPDPVLKTGGLMVDLARRLVTVDGREAKLTPNEFDLLRVLAVNAGKVVTHTHLLREVWGPADVDQTHYVRVYVGQLRRKIEANPSEPRYILTEPGVGYRLALAD
jgi:two-component system, OmpR family, KDP operon response regulator KdpE